MEGCRLCCTCLALEGRQAEKTSSLLSSHPSVLMALQDLRVPSGEHMAGQQAALVPVAGWHAGQALCACSTAVGFRQQHAKGFYFFLRQ